MVIDLPTSIDWGTITSVITFIGGILAKHAYGVLKAKNTLHDTRLVVDALDNAIYNNKIDQNGLEAIYEASRKLLTDTQLVKPTT